MSNPDINNDLFFLKLLENNILSVTNNGIVTNNITKKQIGSLNGGYYRIGFQDPINKKIRLIQIHRLVWLNFKGKIPLNIQINHIDGNKLNNNINNLELCNNAENVKHAYNIGLREISDEQCKISSENMKGEKNPNSKFTNNQVIKLRELYEQKLITINQICQRFNISKRSVKNMLNKITYSNI